MVDKKTVSIFGSTGSVGSAAVDLVCAAPERFVVDTLTAGRNWQKLAEQAKAVNAKCVVIQDDACYAPLQEALNDTKIMVAAGDDAINAAADRAVDLALAAIVGMAGLNSLMRMVVAAKTVAIANKEPLVSAGTYVMAAAQQHQTTLLPVDSEHNALFQVYCAAHHDAIERLVLTASGGPFRDYTSEQMLAITKDQALRHPTWSMGPKITIDSATMMNKGLEIIEASVLFAMPENKIDVLIHPQSTVHGMIAYHDGSVLCQMGPADMRTPIASALAWPDRMQTSGQKLDLMSLSRLDFATPDLTKFPALELARHACREGLGARVALNAANEVAVEAYLHDKIHFTQIVPLVSALLERENNLAISCYEDIFEVDVYTRRQMATLIAEADHHVAI